MFVALPVQKIARPWKICAKKKSRKNCSKSWLLFFFTW